MQKTTRFSKDEIDNPKVSVVKIWRQKEHAVRIGNRSLAKKLRRQLRTINPRYIKFIPKQKAA